MDIEILNTYLCFTFVMVQKSNRTEIIKTMKILSYVSMFLFALLIIACGPKKEGTDAEISEAKEVEEVEASAEYTINTDESKVTWIGSKPAGKHNGNIPVAEGTIAVEGGEIVGGNIIIDIASLENEDLAGDLESKGKLEGHLKSPDFFHTDSFPTAEFVITSVKEYTAADKPEAEEQYDTENKPVTADEYMVDQPTHKVTGNLTMRGETLSVGFPANIKITDGQLTAKAKFNIDRTKWGVTYGAEASVVDKAKDSFIYDIVNIGLELTASESPAM